MRRAINGDQPDDRYVLINLARKLRQVRDEDLAAMDVADAGVALDIFEEHLVAYLDRRGYVRRSGDTIIARLRTPPAPFVGSAALGAMAAVFVIALLVLGVMRWWT